METAEIDAIKEIIATAQTHEQERQTALAESRYEIIKVFFSKKTDEETRNDLMLIRWKKTGQVGLEYRKIFYWKKYNNWHLGRQVKIGIEELDYINQHYSEIRDLLSKQIS